MKRSATLKDRESTVNKTWTLVFIIPDFLKLPQVYPSPRKSPLKINQNSITNVPIQQYAAPAPVEGPTYMMVHRSVLLILPLTVHVGVKENLQEGNTQVKDKPNVNHFDICQKWKVTF